MKNTIYKETPIIVAPSSWELSVLTLVFAIAFIYLLVDTLVNGVGMGDMVLCFAPLFSGLKGKLTKGLNKLNSLVEGGEDEDDDVFDKMINRLEEKVEKATDLERIMEERERKQREKEEERERREKEREEEEERREREREEMEERAERMAEYEEMVREKYERGEELTAKEKYVLSLLMECDEAQADKKRILAEEEERKRREAAEKKEKRKELLSKVGKAVTGLAAMGSSSSNSSSTNNSQTNTSTKKIMRVWTMKYVGPENRKAPNGFVNVPSSQQCYRPTHDEIVEALRNMGYSSVDINSIAGGPDSWWEPV